PFEQGFDLWLWPNRLDLPLTWKTPKRIFVNSMSDLFHERVPDSFIDFVFDTMMRAHWHQFQVLTKRPERMVAYLNSRRAFLVDLGLKHPHIWLGASVESQKYASRAALVAMLPSAVRFLSCEPLLGPLELCDVIGPSRVNWVIVGGESGHGARPMNRDWVLDIRDQCLRARVPFFFKQWGGRLTRRGASGCTPAWRSARRGGGVRRPSSSKGTRRCIAVSRK